MIEKNDLPKTPKPQNPKTPKLWKIWVVAIILKYIDNIVLMKVIWFIYAILKYAIYFSTLNFKNICWWITKWTLLQPFLQTQWIKTTLLFQITITPSKNKNATFPTSSLTTTPFTTSCFLVPTPCQPMLSWICQLLKTWVAFNFTKWLWRSKTKVVIRSKSRLKLIQIRKKKNSTRIIYLITNQLKPTNPVLKNTRRPNSSSTQWGTPNKRT